MIKSDVRNIRKCWQTNSNESQAVYAAEKLAAKLNIKMEKFNPEGKYMSYPYRSYNCCLWYILMFTQPTPQ
jgi:hypothetical protein